VPVAPLDQLLAALADRPSLDVSQVELLLVEVGLRIETRWGGIRYVVGA